MKGKFDAKEYYKKNRQNIIDQTNKRTERKCRECGKKCYGHRCMICVKKGRRNSLSNRGSTHRYNKMRDNKTGGIKK